MHDHIYTVSISGQSEPKAASDKFAVIQPDGISSYELKICKRLWDVK